MENVSIRACGHLFTREKDLYFHLVRCHPFSADCTERATGRSAETVGLAANDYIRLPRRQLPAANCCASFLAENPFVGHLGQDNSPPVEIWSSEFRRDFRNMRSGQRSRRVREAVGVIQLRSWGAHAPAVSGAASHPLGLGAMSPGNFVIPGTGDFVIKCMVPRPRKTNVNNAITSRLSNLGIAHPYARRVMRLRVLQMCGGRAISSTPQDMHSGRAGEVIQLRAWGAHKRVAVRRG